MPTIPDDEVKRLYIRVRASGHKSFWIVYRMGGKQVWLKIGDADVLTLRQAREAARTKLAMVQLGTDPAGEKKAERTASAVTLRSVVEQIFADEGATASERPTPSKDGRRCAAVSGAGGLFQSSALASDQFHHPR